MCLANIWAVYARRHLSRVGNRQYFYPYWRGNLQPEPGIQDWGIATAVPHTERIYVAAAFVDSIAAILAAMAKLMLLVMVCTTKDWTHRELATD
jgi:hypothetical protein